MDFDALIHNGALVTVDPRLGIVDNGWVGIRDGCIKAVEAGGPPAAMIAAETSLDAAGGIIMPGLVNTHTHLPMSLFRGLADDLPLAEWLEEHIFPAEARFIDPTAVRWATLLSCVEMLLSGTTCCCDGYFHEEAVARAVAESGLRAVLGQGIIDSPAPGVPDPARNVTHARAYIQSWRDRSPLITPSLFCHAPYTCGDGTLRAAREAADELDVVLQVHVAETALERERSLQKTGLSPVAHLDRLGVLGRRSLLAHCVGVDDADIEILSRRGCAVAHCPESNMKLGSGIAPAGRMRSAHITVGLGTDGCASNNDLDLFGEMAMAAKLHKVATGDPTALDAGSVLQMATLDGARAIGLDDRIGSLAVGKRADIVVLDTRTPHLTPMYHPESHLVYTAGGADVRHVMVDGRWVVRDRRLLTLNLGEVMDRVNAIAEAIQSHLDR